jgi:hypothetical protein
MIAFVRLWAVIRSDGDVWSLQRDLDSLADWSDEWLLRFNATKCKVMHLGHNLPTTYTVRDGKVFTELQTVTEEKDLGVITTADLGVSVQCAKAAAKASSVLGMIRRNFTRLSVANFNILYKSYVRPHLELCAGMESTLWKANTALNT